MSEPRAKGLLNEHLVRFIMRSLDELLPHGCTFTLLVHDATTGEVDVLSREDPAVTYELFAQLSAQHPDRVEVVGG